MEAHATTELTVVGTSHYQKELTKLAGYHGRDSVHRETVASLVPEPDNPYDGEAVRVDIDGQTIGYLNRDDAGDYFHELMELCDKGAGVTCPAVIIGGAMEGGFLSTKRKHYGVRIWVTEPEDLPQIQHRAKRRGCCGMMTITALAAAATIACEFRRRRR